MSFGDTLYLCGTGLQLFAFASGTTSVYALGAALVAYGAGLCAARWWGLLR